jgi:predicted transcriptional regulator
MDVIAVRMPEKLKEALEKIARKERRTISNMARIAIEDWLIEHGHLDKSDLEESEKT